MITPGRAVTWFVGCCTLAVSLAACGRTATARATTDDWLASCVQTACMSDATYKAPTLHPIDVAALGSTTLSLVALGDSVPSGANCDCSPYPVLIARKLAARFGHRVKVTNDAVAGFTTQDVLDQLNYDADVIAHVRAADVITIEIGANDVPYSADCGDAASCYQSELPPMRAGLAAITSRIHQLAAGRSVLIVLLDYWSIWLGGKYAKNRGLAYVAAAESMTDKVNTAIKAAARRSGSTYIDLRAAFKGPDYSDDETPFLSSDGDHPSATGHRLIADATYRVIRKLVRR